MTLNTIAQIEALIGRVPEILKEIPAEDMIPPRSAGKWSNLQILGHLCDSAINNVTRFIQAQYVGGTFAVTPYDQEQWVAKQNYQQASIDEVITLWVSLNRSIVRVIASLPRETASSQAVELPNGEIKTLEWLIEDYLEHMKHHLTQILPSLLEKD
ncbi:DinB family protein [Paenibacillus sp. P96]|uniref:DinB family protein n=1 Tax=Paenibacillus zeirhizosphaerae TaxID=2987519 RepID=A0ABT9FQT3_9BACL|nr:DinB family protein [Paenibacillus sp. P96]MDP4097098.1 DinB family protein [Paenibacillus sp. P96]